MADVGELGGLSSAGQNIRYKAAGNRLTVKLIMLRKLQHYLDNKKNAKISVFPSDPQNTLDQKQGERIGQQVVSQDIKRWWDNYAHILFLNQLTLEKQSSYQKRKFLGENSQTRYLSQTSAGTPIRHNH